MNCSQLKTIFGFIVLSGLILGFVDVSVASSLNKKNKEEIINIVKKFSPVLKFDKAYRGLPMSAQVYWETMMTPKFDYKAKGQNESADGQVTWTTPWDGPCEKPGVIKVPGRNEKNCGMQNNDFQALRDGRVPTYFRTISEDTGRLRIAYWWFYGFQEHCNPIVGEPGEHHGDWEHIIVTTNPDRSSIEYVTYFFHGKWYTRDFKGIETVDGNRPIVYVGKLAHGSYHATTLSGWMVGTPHHCCEYADYRNPSADSVWDNISDNLVSLDHNQEPWMLADRIGSLYEHEGQKYQITFWRWGPHISYRNAGALSKWKHVNACGTHPTIAKMDWYMSSCAGAGCGTNNCKGLVYDRTAKFNVPWDWDNATSSYDKPLHFECRDASMDSDPETSKAVTYIKSKHSNKREDRVWTLGCSSLIGKTTYCEWTDYINNWDKPMDYVAPGNLFLTGLDSKHSNKREDRIWKTKWCEAQGKCRTNCSWTGYVNNWDAAMELSTGNQVIAGIRSVHSNKREDRRWDFLLCDMVDCETGLEAQSE